MNYYIDLFSPETAETFAQSDMTVTGFRPTQKTYVKNKGIKKGDIFICYLTRVQRFIGVLEVTGDYFLSDKPIFVDKKDPFTLRFPVKTKVWLSPENSIPISTDQIWKKLSFTKKLPKKSRKWTNKVFSSPRQWPTEDGIKLKNILLKQSKILKKYPLSIKDQKLMVPKTKKSQFSRGINFQNKVAQLLSLCGFRVIKNNLYREGPDILIEDPSTGVSLVFQCKYTSKKRNKVYSGINSLVNEYATVTRELEANRGIIVLGGGYTLRKNLNLEKFQKRLHNKKIVLWSDNQIKLYKKLADMMGSFAKYQILADLGINAQFADTIEQPAFEVLQNIELDKKGDENPRTSFIVTKLKADWLIRAASVHRRFDLGGYLQGYQRILEASRIKSMAEYLTKEEWSIPNSIILCTNKKLICSKDLKIKKNGNLKLPSKIGAFWVMDGQHRLYGFTKTEDITDRNSQLMCVIFDSEKMGDNYEEKQANIFVDINYKAKKVSTALLLELMQAYNLINIKQNVGLNIVAGLNSSPLFSGLISGYSYTGGLISLTTFATGVKKLCSLKGPIAKFINASKKTNIEKNGKQLLLKYFKVIHEHFPDEWGNPKYSITSDKGIRGFLRLFARMLKTHERSNFEKIDEYFDEVIKSLHKSNFDFNYSNFKGKYAGEAGADKLLEEMSAFISRYVPEFPHDVKIEEDIIPKEEDSMHEFKSTLRWNLRANKVDKTLEDECLKAICAFSNSGGGILYIGVNDQGKILGLENDIRTLHKKNYDGFLLHLNNIIRERLGSVLSSTINTKFIKDNVCLVKVEISPEPVYLDQSKFYIRQNNQSCELHGNEIHKYLERKKQVEV